MDVDQPSPSAQDTQSIVVSDGTPQGEKEKEERPPELPLLSEQLSLDELWDMLGECLKELEESHDQHAVLVLQPAVEAFFWSMPQSGRASLLFEIPVRASWHTSRMSLLHFPLPP